MEYGERKGRGLNQVNTDNFIYGPNNKLNIACSLKLLLTNPNWSIRPNFSRPKLAEEGFLFSHASLAGLTFIGRAGTEVLFSYAYHLSPLSVSINENQPLLAS